MLETELESVYHILRRLSTPLNLILPAYRSRLKKNPSKSNAPKPGSGTGANSKTRVPQPKSGSAVVTKGPASTGGGETRVEGVAEPKGDEEAAFSEADIPDEEGDQGGNQDEQGLHEDDDEDAGGEEEEEEEEEENDIGSTGNDEDMQVDVEDTGNASQSPQ